MLKLFLYLFLLISAIILLHMLFEVFIRRKSIIGPVGLLGANLLAALVMLLFLYGQILISIDFRFGRGLVLSALAIYILHLIETKILRNYASPRKTIFFVKLASGLILIYNLHPYIVDIYNEWMKS